MTVLCKYNVIYPVRYIIKKEKRKQNKKLECDADKELVKLRREKLHILQSWKWTQWDSDSCTTNVIRFHEQTISRLLIGRLPLNPKDPTDYFALCCKPYSRHQRYHNDINALPDRFPIPRHLQRFTLSPSGAINRDLSSPIFLLNIPRSLRSSCM